MHRVTISMTMLALLFVTILNGALRIQSIGAVSIPARIDNLIITTSDLDAAASRLAQWKNSSGILSIVLNVEWINSTYNGVDEPEKIRNCIKDYYTNSQIKYVTIFGDTDKVPIRYVYVPDGEDNPLVPTDLYYADLKGTWDDNRDGIYGDLGNDTVDSVPDVCVGRIPASLDNTAEDVVTKIIQYKENFDPKDDWTNRIVLAAGESDGNVTSDLSDFYAGYISSNTYNKNITKLYQSFGNLTTNALASQIDEGCFFLNFAGHSGYGLIEELLGIDPVAWFFYWRLYLLTYEGYGWQDALDATNSQRLPIVVTMACSSAKVDWTSSLGGGECIGEYFVMNPHGGAIAYFGSTGIAWYSGNSVFKLMPDMDRRVYETFYGGYTTLGEMWGQSVSSYVKSHGLETIWYNNMTRLGYLDEKTIMEFILLGDPTLRIYNGPRTLKVPEDYATVQGAINDAYDGDTIQIAPGVYNENIVVNKTVSILGADRENTILDSSGVYVTAQGATISNLTVRNSNSSCISLFNANFCNISRNVFDSSSYAGVLLSNSSYNQVSNNSMTNCSNSILISYSSIFNLISDNNIDDRSIGSSGVNLYDCYGNLVSSNTISDTWYGISLSNAQGNIISGNNITNNLEGILLHSSSTNTISGNNITDKSVGIKLYSSSNNSISGNNVTANFLGILLYSSSNYNIVFGNAVSGNTNVTGYQNLGIEIESSLGNIISGNNVTNNYGGIWLVISPSGNSISGNNITNNAYGIGFGCSGNVAYHNNFIDNSQQVASDPGSMNSLDKGYAFGGNYWSDYNGTDAYTGLFQNETGGDGIGDTPYVIDAKNRDGYPLMNPWTLQPDVAIVDVSPFKTVVGLGYSLNISITAANPGDYAEAFNVAVYANASIVGSQNIALSAGDSLAVTFTWNTTGFAHGSYTTCACAWPVLGETDMSDNNFTCYTSVHVGVPGDVSSSTQGVYDGTVDMRDLAYVAKRFLADPSKPMWDPNADINGDGKIDMKDLAIAAKNFLQHYP